MSPRILIVEDEPAIADNILYALETEGFRCRWCATGREGLAALAEPYDLLVLDVGLPDIGGFDLCREIRKAHELPILFLTARAGEIDRVVGLELGADDYVVKPFSPRELAARIKAILRRTAKPAVTPAPAATRTPDPDLTASAPSTAVAPSPDPASPPSASSTPVASGSAQASTVPDPGQTPFVHDTERMSISFFRTKLDLSRYEYRLLGVLLEKPGRVWSREQLMAKVWDVPEASLDRTVDAHVKSLRAKLRQVRPEVEAIVTHRGLGYSLREEW